MDLKVEVLKKRAPIMSSSSFYRCMAAALSYPAFGKIRSKINSISHNRPHISGSGNFPVFFVNTAKLCS